MCVSTVFDFYLEAAKPMHSVWQPGRHEVTKKQACGPYVCLCERERGVRQCRAGWVSLSLTTLLLRLYIDLDAQETPSNIHEHQPGTAAPGLSVQRKGE